ncbi:NAD(P)H-binding protein [Streptomyces sp. TRM43335]|uniref:NAD(P)H-binding protein n=1 Tax=Streptomyces taklimakanensis TaxID=2569853 RepID=A0A6G2B796_9ACTN|nr:NAD(P)H-binding protein [Streptomyces taklimakanensis]MTE18138.1 NAD(P)H-binding protein [Streptomyces taklimakanensis]
MARKPFPVLGGTGKTGRHVVNLLRQRGEDLRAASRSGDWKFDWFDESTWESAVSGAGAIYAVDAQNERAAERLRAFAPFAAERGVERLVLLSARGWEDFGDDDMLDTERALKEADCAWTILRPTWFMQSFGTDAVLRDPLLAGELRLPTGEGREPYIDAEDIAEVAVAALTEDGHAGATYPLSGPRALSTHEVVEEIAKACGRDDLRYVPIAPEEYVDSLVEAGTPRGDAEFLTELFGWIRDGKDAYLSDGVQRVLGREPRDFADFAARAAAAGAWSSQAPPGSGRRPAGTARRLRRPSTCAPPPGVSART